MTLSLQKSVLSAVGGLALLFNTGTALSASSASAWIDWNTFEITAVDLGSGAPSYSLLGEWTSGASSSLPELNAVADGSQLLVSAPTSNSWSNDYGSAYRTATFEVNGYGLLLFTADYAISAAIDGHPDDNAYAEVKFGAGYDSPNAYDFINAKSYFFLEGWRSSADQISKSKTLALALLVNGKDIISFRADSNVRVNAVPVPAAVWLFGSALVGLISVGRRRITA